MKKFLYQVLSDIQILHLKTLQKKEELKIKFQRDLEVA